MKQSGLIQLDYGYQRETIYLPVVLGMSELTAFLQVYKQFTNAGVRKYSHVTTTFLGEKGLNLTSQDVDAVLMVQCTYVDDDHVERTFTLPIPAPKRSLLTFRDGSGYRLPVEQGAILSQAYQQVTGMAQTFRDGWIIA